MASSKWKDWDEFGDLVRARRVVFWGASHWVERTRDRLGPIGRYIVDNNPFNHGIELHGLPVKPPRVLLEEKRDDLLIVITTNNYASVIDELHAMGFVMGDQFCCTPLLSQRRHTDEFKALQRTILMTSPEHAADAQRGGGLYALDTASGQARKLLSGKCRGLARAGENFLMIDMLRGIVVLDKNFREIGTVALGQNAEPHGICYDAARKRAFVSQPGRDSIAVYDIAAGKCETEMFLSDKWNRNKKDNHHLNDLVVAGDSLFVSLFSFSGNWMHECYDGGVLEIDLATGKPTGAVVEGLWMPHSVSRFDGRLTVLDSMRGALVVMNHKTLTRFSAFARGLDYDGRYYYIGLSEHRHPQKLLGVSDNISLDTGVAVFDPDSAMTRFFPLREAESVHSLICLEQAQAE